MATLEVHDGRGRVEFLTIRRDSPVVFGGDPKCDIVLHDAGALPFHGRIRWRRGKYKVEAFPEAVALDVSGRRVVITTFRRGDEIRIGAARIYMINPDEGATDLEKTRVQSHPVAAPPPPVSTPVPAPAPAPPAARVELWRDLEVAAPSDELELSTDPEPPRRPPRPRGLKAWAARFVSALRAREQKPGEEKIVSSPLVLGLALALTTLVLLGVGLWQIIARTTADWQFQEAEDGLKDGDYLNAITLYSLFLERNPQDDRASKARVHRGLAQVKRYASGAGPVWGNALEQAGAMARDLSREPAYADSSAELAELVLRTAEGLADRARLGGDAKTLALAEEAVALHERIAGKAATALRNRSRVPAKLAEAHAAVRKAEARASALAAMEAAIAEKSSANVFAARDALVDQYPDLAADRTVVERLTRANDLIRQAVTFNPAKQAAETTPRPESLGPPTSLVLRSNPGTPAAQAGPSVYALADGFAYGLDGATGAPLWQVPVGLSSPFAPVAVPGDVATVLVFDARHDELLRLDARTGGLIWRQALGGPIADPPLVLGNQVIQATPPGTLRFLHLGTGEITGTLDLKRPLATTPVADDNGQFFYVLADRSSLFVVRREPPACVGVEYLGHEPGSIACPPARLGRYLIVAENHTPTSGRWTVYLLDPDGSKARVRQALPTPGWTWSTPPASGSVVWSVGDRGAVAAFALGPYEARTPLTTIAQVGLEDRPSGPAFARARTERELLLSSGRTARFDLNAERGTLAPAWTLTAAGASRGPIQVAGRLAVFTQQAGTGPGLALWGVNPVDGAIAWRTVLGAPWPVDLAPMPDGDGLSTLAADGRPIRLTRSQLVEGGFVESPLPKDVEPVLPAGPIDRLQADGLTVIATGPGARSVLVREGDGPFRTTPLPAPLAATPLLWGTDLLVPAADGRVYLIDPRNATSRAEPYVPPFDRARSWRWLDPARLEGDAVALVDASGRVRRLTRTPGPGSRLVVAGDPLDLDGPIATDPATTTEALVLATSDGKIRVFSGRDFSPSGTFDLGGARAWGPVAVSGHAFVADATGGVLAFGPDGRRLWAIDVGDAPSIGPPAIHDGSAWLLGPDGTLQRRDLADGSALETLSLGIFPVSGPLVVGPDLALPVGRGTIRLWSAEGATGASSR